MSSDDGLSEYHNNKVQHHLQLSPKKPGNHHQQLSIHHEPTSSSSIASASTQTINCCEIAGSLNGSTIKRRKSATLNTASPAAFSIHHALQTVSQSTPHNDLHENANTDDDTQIIGQQTKSNANPINNYNFSCNATGTGNGIMPTNNLVSPSKYMHHNENVYLHMSGSSGGCLSGSSRLSIHNPTSSDRYDSEINTCCLQPPSPAPCDRFLGIPSPSIPSQHHAHSQLYQQTPITENKFSNLHHRSMSPSSR